MGNISTEVMEMLAAERGLPIHRISMSSRLAQDLGMDGDDAVDFFVSIRGRYGTDLTALDEHWTDHFAPEGLPLRSALLFLPPAILGGVIVGVAHFSKAWMLPIMIALFVLEIWALRRWGPPDRSVPVTVADVIAAVEAGTWPRPN